jgi:hypothetical protein
VWFLGGRNCRRIVKERCAALSWLKIVYLRSLKGLILRRFGLATGKTAWRADVVQHERIVKFLNRDMGAGEGG